MSTLIDFLSKLNLLLEDAAKILPVEYGDEIHRTLQPTEAGPDTDKTLWELMSKTVDAADRLVKMLQPPAIQLAETYLGTLQASICSKETNSSSFHPISVFSPANNQLTLSSC